MHYVESMMELFTYKLLVIVRCC